MSENRVRIFDTTLRDGEQAPGFSLRVSEKLQLARQLDRLGVDIIEAGFPIASPADAEAVRRISMEIRRPVIACLARCHRADLEKAAWSIEPAARGRIHTFIATSDLHLQAKLRMTREQCLESAVDAVRFARQHTDDVQFSAEDATRSDFEFLCRVVDAVIAAGATTINLPDTVGFGTPDETRDFFTRIRERVPAADGVVFSAHCHDDLGLAVANSIAAVQGGARQVECTINGIGERAGNAALEEIVMAFHVRRDRLQYAVGIEQKEIYPSSEMVTKLTGQGVQVNKAIVGRNAFAHEAGIHQDGILKDRRTYEIMRAEDVGAPWNPLVLGKHSGRHAVQKRCNDLGLEVEGAELIEVYRALMAIADDRKQLTDDDIVAVVSSVRTSQPQAAAPVDPFDTPSAAPHALHETGYGHGV
ncbi:MAG: 2-isopropylmalate synthase [Acidobacteria bacterium RIFCSPLOWO2_12_FULL_67_14]|nr:MAG: 2-isopropylmalate synthase [Acidobacteria bacterium RIFCSPLOWO2_02_FULL_67_21]OFW38581.1 MAG: 2-isopropylmalate synthase [Acidobacteria bacterium RIFCSPLOWO2_12_FULL_67_14]